MARNVAQARLASTARYSLGEGIIERDGVVAWVDINAGLVLTGSLEPPMIERSRDLTSDSPLGSISESRQVHVDRSAGAVAFATDGGLLVAAARGLATISPAGVVSLGPDLLGDRSADVRLNDGAVDPQGRYVVGSLTDDAETTNEVLLRVSPDGTVETLRSGVTLSNGIGWSPDGGTIYHIDTFSKTVAAHSYDASGDWDATAWVVLPHEFIGYPDGLTVDASGDLWIAQWGAGVVQRFAASGAVLETIEVPTPQVSAVGFVAPGLVAITTSTDDTDGDPLAGALFLCEVDATGLPESQWTGSTTNPYWSEQ